jgi:hypothetical protein
MQAKNFKGARKGCLPAMRMVASAPSFEGKCCNAKNKIDKSIKSPKMWIPVESSINGAMQKPTQIRE